MTDERLLPMHYRLTGNEGLRVIGANGQRMLLPVSVLLDDIAVLKARVLVLEAEIKLKKDKDK